MAMTPQEQAEFNKMKREIRDIQQATDTKFVAELLRRIGGVKLTLETGSLTGTSVTVRDAAGTGTEIVADDYAGVIELSDANGNTYRLGYYT